MSMFEHREALSRVTLMMGTLHQMNPSACAGGQFMLVIAQSRATPEFLAAIRERFGESVRVHISEPVIVGNTPTHFVIDEWTHASAKAVPCSDIFRRLGGVCDAVVHSVVHDLKTALIRKATETALDKVVDKRPFYRRFQRMRRPPRVL